MARIVLILGAVVTALVSLQESAAASCHGGITYSGGVAAMGCGAVAAVASGITIALAVAGTIATIAVSAMMSHAGTGAASTTSAAGGGAGSGGHPRRDATPVEGMCTAGDPVNLATGDMVHPQTDVALDGMLELVLRRTHLSSYRSGRLFGPSWASTLDQRLDIDEHGVMFLTEDGMRLRYPGGNPTGPVLPIAGPRWALSRSEDGGYVVVQPELGRQLWFGPGERICPLVAVTDRAGHRIDVRVDGGGTPTEVVHSGGFRIAVRSDSGLVTELVLDGQGESSPVTLVRYRYDPQRRLVEVINSSGLPMLFGYDPDGRITRWQDRNGQWYGYVYDEQGRVIRTEGSANALTGRFDYHEQSTVFTDSLGHSTVYRFNGAGQLVREIDPLGNVTVTEWDPYDRLLAWVDPLGRTTSYEYDDAGNLTVLTHPDGTRLCTQYNNLGLPTTVTEPDGTVWRYGYDDRGQLLTVTDPAGAVTRYTYDERHHLSSVTDASGAVRHLECDAKGLLVGMTDALGAVTRFERDHFGRVVAITDPLGGTTRSTWTTEGRLLSRVLPDGTTETWRYDPQGNEIEHVDALGQVTSTERTVFGHPSAVVGPDGARTQFGYDSELRLISVTNTQGLTWSYQHDAAGNLVRERDFNGRLLRYAHDAAGQLASRTNGADETVVFVRDVMGNVRQQHTGQGITTFEYGPTGRLLRAVNAHVEVVLQHDPLGRVVAETVNGRTTASRFDPLGRRVWRRTPAGVESSWEFDANDRPIALHTTGHTLRFTYDAAGREIQRQLDNGPALEQSWDGNDRLLSQTLQPVAAGHAGGSGLLGRRFRYRADGYLTAVEDDDAGVREFDLDVVGRVTTVRARTGQEQYTYDVEGNITQAGWPTGDAGPDGQGPREYAGTLIRAAGNIHYLHDAQGRMVLRRKLRPSGQPVTWQYTWDAEDQLVGVTTPDGTQWRYLFDPFGRRVAKLRLGANGIAVERIDFAWDGLELVEQTHSAGHTTTWDCDPDDSRPLIQSDRVSVGDPYQQRADMRCYQIVTDVVGTPTELVDAFGAVSWRARSTLWGDVVDRSGQQAYTPLRFPGQHYDPESELSFNYFRHYDPQTGRYSSADPLGLVGGHNPHAYVANPVVWADPLGLARRGYNRNDRGGRYGRYPTEVGGGRNPNRYVANPVTWADPRWGRKSDDVPPSPSPPSRFDPPSLRHPNRPMQPVGPGNAAENLAKAVKSTVVGPSKAILEKAPGMGVNSLGLGQTPGSLELGVLLVALGAWRGWKAARSKLRRCPSGP